MSFFFIYIYIFIHFVFNSNMFPRRFELDSSLCIAQPCSNLFPREFETWFFPIHCLLKTKVVRQVIPYDFTIKTHFGMTSYIQNGKSRIY